MSSRVSFRLPCKIKSLLQLRFFCTKSILQWLLVLLLGINFIKPIDIDKIFAIEATKWSSLDSLKKFTRRIYPLFTL